MYDKKILIAALVVLALSGCTTHSGHFHNGVEAMQKQSYDQAVFEFGKALDKNPGETEYISRLATARALAATKHLDNARGLRAEGKLTEASGEYGLAMALDPTLDVARLELEKVSRELKLRTMMAEAEAHFVARRLPQAKTAVKAVLEFDPEYEPAKAMLKQIIEVRNTIVGGFELAVDSNKPITLKFKDAKLQEAFKILSQLSGINFIFDEDIKNQTVTLLLEDATFAQALELLLKMNNLGTRILNPKTVIIYDNTTEKQKQYDDQIIQTFYLSSIDAKKAVNMLRTMLQLRKVYVHEELNAIVVRDTPEVIKLVEQMLENADLADSEVVFDLELIEVTHGDLLQFGPTLSPYSLSGTLVTGAGTAAVKRVSSVLPDSGVDGLIQGISGLDGLFTLPTATFDFSKTLTDTDILATPKIRVKNREKAKVHVGSREPTLTSTVSGDNVSSNVQYVDVGIKVDVEPIVQLDGSVSTKVRLEVSSKGDKLTSSDQNTVAYQINTTTAETALLLKDGERTIIGGLIRDVQIKTRKSIPFLGDIPLLGALFTNYDTNDSKREILLSITPRIVKNIDLPGADKARIWSGGEDDLKAGANFTSFAEEPDFSVPAAPEAAVSTQNKQPTPLQSKPTANKPVPVPVLSPTPQAESIVPPPVVEPSVPIPSAASAPEALPPSPVITTPVPTAEPVAAPQPLSSSAAETGEDASQVAQVLIPPAEIKTVPEQAKIFFTGSKLVHPGEEFVLDLQIAEVTGLFSAPMFVNYDQQLLTYLRFEEGDFLKTSGQASIFSLSPNPKRGELIIGSKQTTGGAGVEGSATLCPLYFKANAAGIAVVRPNRENLRASDGSRLAATSEPFQVEIR